LMLFIFTMPIPLPHACRMPLMKTGQLMMNNALVKCIRAEMHVNAAAGCPLNNKQAVQRISCDIIKLLQCPIQSLEHGCYCCQASPLLVLLCVHFCRWCACLCQTCRRCIDIMAQSLCRWKARW
jgi:hypothetical protein